MSNHQQVTIVRDTAESNNETDALAAAMQQQSAPSEAQPKAERPTWLPEKFQSPDDLAKAYTELEKKIGSKPVDVANLETYTKEFQEKGDLSDESIKAITTNMGIPENIVRAYVDGQKAIQESNLNVIMSYAGGKPQYDAMIEWAGNSIPDEEIDAFNSIIDSGNMNSIRMAVSGLKARYEQANGSASGRLIQGETTGPSGGAFRSVAEIVAAMKDPRYAKDPAYRRDVEQRVSMSNALGVNR